MAVLGLTLFTFLAMSGRIFAASREARHRQAAQSILDNVVAEVRAQPAAYADGSTRLDPVTLEGSEYRPRLTVSGGPLRDVTVTVEWGQGPSQTRYFRVLAPSSADRGAAL